ncbi:MAG: extracellular solute-binding protein [Pseudomonadota bacterium]
MSAFRPRLALFRLAAAALALVVASPAAADPYAPFRGESVRVMFPNHPHYDIARSLLPLFTEETGIEVEVDMFDYLPMRERQARELAEPEGRYDLISYVVFSKADYVSADQLWPLAPFLMDPLLADPGFAPEDIVPSFLENIGVAGGRGGYLNGPLSAVYGLPFGAETSVLAYRRDVFERHGLTPPATYEAFVELACRIGALENGMAGIVMRSAPGHQASHGFLLHLAPLGGRIFDEDWRVRVNDAAGVRAAETLRQLVACGPEDGRNIGWAQTQQAFLEGRAAMYLDSTSIAAAVMEAGMQDVVGYAPHPAGVRHASQTGGFGLGIPRNASNPDLGFLLMQWLTSPTVDRMIAERGGTPIRMSTYADPDLNVGSPHLALFGKALANADADWRPIIRVWGRINDTLGKALGRALAGEITIEAALNSLVDPIEALMAQEGYYARSGDPG